MHYSDPHKDQQSITILVESYELLSFLGIAIEKDSLEPSLFGFNHLNLWFMEIWWVIFSMFLHVSAGCGPGIHQAARAEVSQGPGLRVSPDHCQARIRWLMMMMMMMMMMMILHMGDSINEDTTIAGWFISWKIPAKMADWGVPWGTHIHIYIYTYII